MSTKRYQMVFSEDLHAEIQRIADKHHVTVEEAMRKAVKLFLLLDEMDPGEIRVTVDGEEKGLMLFGDSQEA